MGDTQAVVGAGPGEVTETLVSPPVPNGPSPREARAAKIAAAREGMKTATLSDEPKLTAEPVVEAKPAEKPAEVVEEKPDAQTAKAIESIEKRDKRQREQLAADRAAAKTELEAERAELARLRAEATGKTAPLDDLKKLPAAKRAIEALKLAGLDPDDEDLMDVIARDTYARSKSGKSDPKNRAYADQVAEKQGLQSELAELRKMVEETRETITQKEQRQQAEAFQQRYLDETVKLFPTEPTLIAQHHKTNPAKARAALLDVGQRLERENGETPTQAEVIERYEAEAKQDLRDRGFSDAQIASMLAPSAPAKPAASTTTTRTLDPSTGPTTTPLPGSPNRDSKIAAARAGLRKLAQT